MIKYYGYLLRKKDVRKPRLNKIKKSKFGSYIIYETLFMLLKKHKIKEICNELDIYKVEMLGKFLMPIRDYITADKIKYIKIVDFDSEFANEIDSINIKLNELQWRRGL